MTERIPIKNYQRTNAKALLKLTEKLFNKNYFDLYLTSQQLVVLEYLLSISSEEDKLKAWDYFLKGNIALNVEKSFPLTQEEEHHGAVSPAVDTRSDDVSSQTIKDNNNTNTNTSISNENHVENEIEDKGDNAIANEDNFVNNDESDNVEEDLFKLDLEDLKQQISGTRFIGNLSLKIRYVLWQCAIDYIYCDRNEFGDENDTEYTLLDVEEKEEEEIGKNEKPQNKEGISKFAEDEDYDDEDENYDEDSTDVKNVDDPPKMSILFPLLISKLTMNDAWC